MKLPSKQRVKILPKELKVLGSKDLKKVCAFISIPYPKNKDIAIKDICDFIFNTDGWLPDDIYKFIDEKAS